MFIVKENNKPAKYVGNKDWGNCYFPTFQQALQYCKQWLGEWDTLPDNWDGSAYDYNGYGDKVSITEVINPEIQEPCPTINGISTAHAWGPRNHND